MRYLKQLIIRLHSLLGSLLSLMFVMWFLSGFVMIFASFPHASKEKAFSHLEAITCQELMHLRTPTSDLSEQLVVEKRHGKVIYEFRQSRGNENIYDATSLKKIDHYSEEDVLNLACSFSGADLLSYEKCLELDQWMPWSYCQSWLPIYKCDMNDEAHTQLYISAVNGLVVQETTRNARWAARLGAIPHWIYFKSIRLKTGFWLRLVYWISLLGVFASLSGLILGFIRLKRRKKRASWSNLSVYKKFWYKWHHITGFVFGLFVFTFILSGLVSVSNIPQFIAPVHNKQSARKLWNQKGECYDSLAITPKQIGALLHEDTQVKRIIWKKVMGKACVHVFCHHNGMPEVYILKGNELERKLTYTKTEIETWTKRLFKNTSFSLNQLYTYNAYYPYAESGDYPIPVWQLQVDDADQSSLYIHPLTGEVIRSYNTNRRWRRWLYNGLHSFDFPFLSEYEWLRKLLLILLSVGGTFVSVSALVLTWRVLLKKVKPEL
ncbi:hypothetical protein DWB61_06110 [Ancylomarina euxinus]|uniref:PepSY domain-containing protein n=1 Tax=Ancylomarina euxinus TaxID=2283627 RepID=A0A425Y419_9BACT|nr:PepSY domain-containing protein [Ancylomarina euxinus]MCZ4694610.1 PepSY domain-containing protein [Ancylomarina euxinus]MUP14153.1 hypothetical protein [Ancylomarina euxinus]RRG23009.1 hypothetical protein DWB61_06110 [Ancylomarina euxinus]